MRSLLTSWVKEGGMVRLDKRYLQASYKGVGSDDIVYTILNDDGQPRYGRERVYFQMFQNHLITYELFLK